MQVGGRMAGGQGEVLRGAGGLKAGLKRLCADMF